MELIILTLQYKRVYNTAVIMKILVQIIPIILFYYTIDKNMIHSSHFLKRIIIKAVMYLLNIDLG